MIDHDAAHELTLFITNDGDLYRQRAQPIMKNLARKRKAGTYDPTFAVKAWRHLADDGARRYTKEFGGRFDVPTRIECARQLGESYAEEMAEV